MNVFRPRSADLFPNTVQAVAKFLFLPLALGAFIVIFSPTYARAGFVEIGGSGSYRKSTIDQDAYDQTQSITGSLTYYFDESSALEFSYTNGISKRAIAESEPNGHVTTMFYSMLGLDFIYTLGEREAAFRPYLKAGVNYILEKKIVDQYRGIDGSWMDPNIVQDKPSFVPSFGAGVKIMLTKSLSLKVGVDAWASNPINQRPFTLDYAGRVGIGFMF